MRHLTTSLVVLAFVCVCCMTSPLRAEEGVGYDPSADPFADLQAAQKVAAAEHKNILLKVGGNWCSWCRMMERFIGENKDLEKALDAAFVSIKVSYSDENKNERFLADYPPVPGYPHLFVLNASGELLHSQDTAELESGRGYSKEAFLDLIKTWAPKGDES